MAAVWKATRNGDAPLLFGGTCVSRQTFHSLGAIEWFLFFAFIMATQRGDKARQIICQLVLIAIATIGNLKRAVAGSNWPDPSNSMAHGVANHEIKMSNRRQIFVE